MTRTANTGNRQRSGAGPKRRPADTWIFQDAKARLSEVVRRARNEGPQRVTVHGRPAVVILAEEEFRRMKAEATGAALVDAMQASPSRRTEIEPRRGRMPVRDVEVP